MAMAHHALAGQLNVFVLGVCLGHQALALADGRQVISSPFGPVHGVPVEVDHDRTGVFRQQGQGLKFTRYNSLVAVEDGEHQLLVNATEASSASSWDCAIPHERYTASSSIQNPSVHATVCRSLLNF